jgi:hypothetical protein
MAARTVTFTVLISAAAGLVFGISPAIRAPRIDLQQMLQDCNRGYCGGRGQKRFLDALIIPEVGLSMLLLVAAGLLIRTLTALRSVDPGFRADHVLVNTMLVLPTEKYDSAPKRIDLFTPFWKRRARFLEWFPWNCLHFRTTNESHSINLGTSLT